MSQENQMELLEQGATDFLKDIQNQVLKQKFHCQQIGEMVTYSACMYGEMRECPTAQQCKRNELDKELLNLSLCIKACA